MAQFDDLVTLVRHLTDRSIQDGSVSGNLRVDSSILTALKACESDPDNTPLTLLDPSDINTVTINSTVQLEIETPRLGFGLLSENIDTLLRFPKAHVKEPPQPYYLLDSDYYKDDITPSGHIVVAYRTVLQFVAMLRTCAAFLDEQEETLVFIKNGKFDVPVKFTEKDLRSVNLETLEELSLPTGTHEKQCASIMAESVHNLTAKFPPAERFAALLKNANELKESFENGYKLFASGFSYDKVRDEIEAARVEYSGKIHKIVSDIQNQLLGIPVATLIVATQMKDSAKVDLTLWTNVAILIGSFVFTLLMHFLLRNQRQTLEVISLEIQRQKRKLEKEHAAIADNFESTFKSLEERSRSQRRILWIIESVVGGSCVLSLIFFFRFSEPAQAYFLGVFQWAVDLSCTVSEKLRKN